MSFSEIKELSKNYVQKLKLKSKQIYLDMELYYTIIKTKVVEKKTKLMIVRKNTTIP